MMQQSTTGLEIMARAHQAEMWRAADANVHSRTGLGSRIPRKLTTARLTDIWARAQTAINGSATLKHATAEE